jgi:hypothetical protein
MYAVCTFEMVRAMSLDFLLPIAQVFVYVALLAWTATFIGLIRSLVSSLIPALHSTNGGGDFASGVSSAADESRGKRRKI